MTKLLEIYKCNVCGNVVEVVGASYGELVCCGQPMNLLHENTVDASTEKHVPVLSAEGVNKTIRVGSIPHPMEEAHYIMFIEAISHDGVFLYRKFLKPGDDPSFEFECKTDKMIARELCNIHGLWSKNYD